MDRSSRFVLRNGRVLGSSSVWSFGAQTFCSLCMLRHTLSLLRIQFFFGALLFDGMLDSKGEDKGLEVTGWYYNTFHSQIQREAWMTRRHTLRSSPPPGH